MAVIRNLIVLFESVLTFINLEINNFIIKNIMIYIFVVGIISINNCIVYNTYIDTIQLFCVYSVQFYFGLSLSRLINIILFILNYYEKIQFVV